MVQRPLEPFKLERRKVSSRLAVSIGIEQAGLSSECLLTRLNAGCNYTLRSRGKLRTAALKLADGRHCGELLAGLTAHDCLGLATLAWSACPVPFVVAALFALRSRML